MRISDIRGLNELIELPRGERAEHGILETYPVALAGHYSRAAGKYFGDHYNLENRDFFEQCSQRLEQHSPPIQGVILKDALIFGQGGVVTRTGVLIRDSVNEFLAHGITPEGLENTSGQLSLSGDSLHHLPQPALLLKRPWWRNYGHWLVDAAALLALSSGFGLGPDEVVITGAFESPNMARVVEDSVKLVRTNLSIIPHADNDTWLCSHLRYVSPVHIPPLFKLPAAISALRALTYRNFPSTPANRRFYIPRPQHIARHIKNEEEIAAIFTSYDFEVIYPEDLSFLDQANLFCQAQIIAGPKGAALTNIIFSSNNAKLLVLSPAEFIDPFFWDLAAQQGRNYTEIFGRIEGQRQLSPSQNNFFIDLEYVEVAMRGMGIRDFR